MRRERSAQSDTWALRRSTPNTRGIRRIGAMNKKLQSLWQRAFTNRLTNPCFQGTGWEDLYAALSHASTTTDRGAKPLWVGVELTYPRRDLGYVGVLCADDAGEVLSTSELQRHTRALEDMRSQWPDGQLRFLTNVDDLNTAARRSRVFSAVVDATSPSSLTLAKSLAKDITIGNTHTELRVLTLVSRPSNFRIARPTGPIQRTPAAFDVLIRSRTSKPWLEHRDLAVMCAVHKTGFVGVDFNDVCRIFKKYEHASAHWIPRRPTPVAAKGVGVARGLNRAECAAKQAIREIAASFPLSQVTGGIIDISGDTTQLRDARGTLEAVRAVCPDEAQFVLNCDAQGYGLSITITFIAVTGGFRRHRAY